MLAANFVYPQAWNGRSPGAVRTRLRKLNYAVHPGVCRHLRRMSTSEVETCEQRLREQMRALVNKDVEGTGSETFSFELNKLLSR